MKSKAQSPKPKVVEAFAFVPVVRGQNKLEVRNASETDPAEIILIGAIGKNWWDDSGITEQEVRDALKSIPAGKPINVRINSEGGSVKEGLGIYNAFKERRADLTAHISGYALSIASVFPLGAHKVVSPKSAIWMMHKAWSWNQGNADDMRHAAEMLDAHDETLVDIYAAETGKTKEAIRAAMEAETWIKGADAVAWGLADETDPEESPESNAQGPKSYRPLAKEFLNRCKNVAPEILNMLSAAPKQGAAKPQTQNHPDPMRKQMEALLNEWGVKFEANATDEQIAALVKAGKPTTTTASPGAASAGSPTTTADTSAEIKAMKRRLIRAEIVRLGENKIENANLDRWVNRAETEGEEAIYAEINAMNPIVDAGAPVGFSFNGDISGGSPLGDYIGMPTGITGFTPRLVSNSLENIRKAHPTPLARAQAMSANWETILHEAIRKDFKAGKHNEVLAANTYSGTLVTSFLMDGSLTNLTNVLAFLNAYSLAKDVDPFKPLATGVLKHVTAGEATQTDPTNFEPNTGSTIDPISVATHWYNQPMRVGPVDLNSGLRMQDLVTQNLANFTDKITQVATAPFTAANFSTLAPEISSAAAFNWSNAQSMRGKLKKSPIKNLVLDGAYLARLENVPTNYQDSGVGAGPRRTFGWDGIYDASNWTGAGANVVGAFLNPQAIIRATGLPLTPPNIPGGVFQTMSFQVPGAQVAVAMSVWFSLASRTLFTSWDVIAGFAAGDTTAAGLLASGAPG